MVYADIRVIYKVMCRNKIDNTFCHSVDHIVWYILLHMMTFWIYYWLSSTPRRLYFAVTGALIRGLRYWYSRMVFSACARRPDVVHEPRFKRGRENLFCDTPTTHMMYSWFLTATTCFDHICTSTPISWIHLVFGFWIRAYHRGYISAEGLTYL
jgi:hypothetical protein